MYRTLRFIPALGAVLFALAALSACGGIPGNAVVQVNGTAVTKDAFKHWMGIAATASSPTAGSTSKPAIPEPPTYKACIAHLQATTPAPAKGQAAPTTAQLKSQCEQQYKQLQQQVLGFLISSDWVIGEAAHLGVKLSDAEVHKQFQKIKSQQFPRPAEFEKFLTTTGQTTSDLLLRVKLNLLSSKIQEKIAKKKHAVTKAEVEKFYNENKQRYGTPEKRNVEIILTKTEAAAKKAKQEVESGKSFASVAKQVSIDPTSKANGGLLSEVAKGQQEKSLDAALFSAKPGVLGGPLKTAFGYYVYRVKSSTPGNQQSLAQAESAIKSQLTATQSQTALTKFVKEFRTKWKGKTDCRSGYVVKDCKQFKEPKTSTTTTGAP
ncbi:MAG TPA: peptidyl-prolyl cis-trans isomerase [Solirubrobacteraceae bacterium]|jgi:foldase protein PrsA|nr:peptidyl-prolyl cis-trans isomerase [Solirubrobacteraceae bacterium]